MEKTWKDYVGVHSTIEGARAAFEKDCEELLQLLNPGQNVKVVRANPGDEGIDIYIGEIGVSPISVYQCKFFLDALGDSQKGQIRESFKRAINSEYFEVKEWILCTPLNDSDINESIWWATWKAEKEVRHGIPIHLINGSELINKMKQCNIYNRVFQIDGAIKLDAIYAKIIGTSNPESIGVVLPSTAVPTAAATLTLDKVLYRIAFSLNYKEGYEDFYVPREADQKFGVYLQSIKHIWVYGESGMGKTTLCVRNLSVKRGESYYCYLNSVVNPQSAKELLDLVFESMCEKYESFLDGYRKSNNVVRSIAGLLCLVTPNSDLTIYIDEVRVYNDDVFKQFVNDIVAISEEYEYITTLSRRVKFVISTIKNPREHYYNKTKAAEYFGFVKVEAWNKDELLVLVNKINSLIGNITSHEQTQELIEECESSPRILKNILTRYVDFFGIYTFSKIIKDVQKENI